MRASLLPVLALCSLAISGCSVVYSVNPLHKSEDKVEVPALVGTWVPDKTNNPEEFCIEKSDQGFYVLVFSDPDSKIAQRYLVGLVSLEDRLFMDIQFDKQVIGNIEAGDPIGTIPHHAIVKVDILGDELTYAPMDAKEVLKQNERDYYPVDHLMIDDDAMLLTASTEDLRQYISKHVDDVFSDSEHLFRKPESGVPGKPCWAFDVPTNP
jgi:hypothetical protein